MTIHKVTIIGATGRLGPAVERALAKSNAFEVTSLRRAKNRMDDISPMTERLKMNVTVLPHDYPQEALVSALRGQDALVSTLNAASTIELHKRLGDACVEAGVRRFIPADYGSVDSEDAVARELVPAVFDSKKQVRAHLSELSRKHGEDKFSWTGIVCGHFLDWGLPMGLLGIDLKTRSATLFDGGDVEFSASTLPRIADAVVRVLKAEEQTRNRLVYVQSVCTTQRALIHALETAEREQSSNKQSPSGEWKTTTVSSEEYIAQQKPGVAAGDHDARENMVAVLGITRANWVKSGVLDHEVLGLQDQDLGVIVGSVLKEFEEKQDRS